MQLKPYKIILGTGLALASSCGADRPSFTDEELREDTTTDGGDESPVDGVTDEGFAGSSGLGGATGAGSSLGAGAGSSLGAGAGSSLGPSGSAGAGGTATATPGTGPEVGVPAPMGAGGSGGSASNPMIEGAGAQPGVAETTCALEQTMCGAECVDTRSSVQHCGGCGQPCAVGEVCSSGTCEGSCASTLLDCGGSCVDVSSDPAHCGDCDVACPPVLGGTPTCDMGVCGVECNGTTLCDSACVDTQVSAAHCGGCGQPCGAGEVCSLGTCETSCDSPLTACDGACVDLDTDAANCGTCGMMCPTPTGGMATCDGGTCGIECNGLTACQGACVDTMTDDDHCGGCQNPCNGECVNGTCCPSNRAVCSGACVDLDSSAAHCGSCGNDCSGGEVCEGGECLVNCTNGTRCGDDCVNLASDLQNCKSCGTVCPSPAANGQAVCGSSGCEISCNTNSLPCGNTCCNPPASASVEAVCNGSTCGVQCASGNHSCTGGSPTQCYDDQDPLHCGSACTNCTQQYATAQCSGGQCANVCTGGPDIGCDQADGKPVCGFWSFETSSSDTEGWVLDTALSDAATGVFGVSTQHPSHGTRSLAIGYNGNATNISADAKIELCPTGLADNLGNRDFSFDVYPVSSGGPFSMNQSGGYMMWWNGPSTNQGNCDFTFSEGTKTSVTCTEVPTGQITAITIRLRVFVAWAGTFYIDNIRFE